MQPAAVFSVVPAGLTSQYWDAEKCVELRCAGARIRVPFAPGPDEVLDWGFYYRPAKGLIPELALLFAYCPRAKILFFHYQPLT